MNWEEELLEEKWEKNLGTSNPGYYQTLGKKQQSSKRRR